MPETSFLDIYNTGYFLDLVSLINPIWNNQSHILLLSNLRIPLANENLLCSKTFHSSKILEILFFGVKSEIIVLTASVISI
jgi:hypothetical protein